jgi:hypothetical protein
VRRYLLIAVALVLVAIFVGFCSRGNDERGGWQPCERSPEAIPHASGATDVVLRIDQSGGLPPPSFMPDSIPDLTLYGDGRLIGTDAATAGQLVPGLAGRQLTEDEVQALLHNAEAACLLQRDASLDLPGVYDVPGISFEANTGSASHQTFAIGLGWSEMDPNVPSAPRSSTSWTARSSSWTAAPRYPSGPSGSASSSRRRTARRPRAIGRP